MALYDTWVWAVSPALRHGVSTYLVERVLGALLETLEEQVLVLLETQPWALWRVSK